MTSPPVQIDTPRWWQTRWFMLAAIVAAIVPLLWPPVAPLTDLPGHIGAFRIMTDAHRAPLSNYYAVHWTLIGNLGVDALVLALRPLLGLETATKLVVMAIPALSVAAMLWAAQEAHGRLPASAAFAFTLAYAAPFQLGFVNFALSSALALAGLAGWLHLARDRAAWVRAAVFVPLACLVWLCHAFGWAMLGLFVFGAEWVIRCREGRSSWRAAALAAAMCLPMALPLLATLTGLATAARGDTGDWFDFAVKLIWIVSLLRERWQFYDILSVAVLLTLLAVAARSPHFRFEPLLGVPAALGTIAFLALPRIFQGGAYVDMRILPCVVALAVLAIRRKDGDDAPLAFAAVGFFALRLATTAIAFALIWAGQARALRALPALPVGSRVLVLVNETAKTDWANPRLTHIAGLAIARRRIFTNEQWSIAGQQLITPISEDAAPFDRDPSQIVYPSNAGYQITDFDQAIGSFDRRGFGYVWTIGFPSGRAHATDLRPIWSDGESAVYRVANPA